MRLATWNVNSIRARVDRIVDFAVREHIDVLAMQEIKCKVEQFPFERFEEAGFHVEAHGFSQWNGVAIASREPVENVRTAFPGMPGFEKGLEALDARRPIDMPQVEMQRQDRPPQLDRLVDRYLVQPVDIVDESVRLEPAPTAHRFGAHIGLAERREPSRAYRPAAVIGV